MRVDAATDADAAAVQYALLVSEAELQSLLRLRDAIALRARLRLRKLPIALIANPPRANLQPRPSRCPSRCPRHNTLLRVLTK